MNTFITGWWFGTFFIFPYIWDNHPNWLSYFSEGFKPPASLVMPLEGEVDNVARTSSGSWAKWSWRCREGLGQLRWGSSVYYKPTTYLIFLETDTCWQQCCHNLHSPLEPIYFEAKNNAFAHMIYAETACYYFFGKSRWNLLLVNYLDEIIQRKSFIHLWQYRFLTAMRPATANDDHLNPCLNLFHFHSFNWG